MNTAQNALHISTNLGVVMHYIIIYKNGDNIYETKKDKRKINDFLLKRKVKDRKAISSDAFGQRMGIPALIEPNTAAHPASCLRISHSAAAERRVSLLV